MIPSSSWLSTVICLACVRPWCTTVALCHGTLTAASPPPAGERRAVLMMTMIGQTHKKKGSQNRATDTLDTLCSQSLPHREGRRLGTIHPGRDVGRLSVKDHLRSVSPSMCTTFCPSPSTSCKRATADDQTAALQDPGAPTTITNTGLALQLNQQGFMMRERRLLRKRKFPPQTTPPTAYDAGKYHLECENSRKRTSCRSKP